MQLNIFDKKIEAKQIDSTKLLELAEYNVHLNNFEEVSKEEFFATVGQLDVILKTIGEKSPYSTLWILRTISEKQIKWPFEKKYYFKLRNFDFNKYKP
jgi:uncharacterized protein (DUF111 family)